MSVKLAQPIAVQWRSILQSVPPLGFVLMPYNTDKASSSPVATKTLRRRDASPTPCGASAWPPCLFVLLLLWGRAEKLPNGQCRTSVSDEPYCCQCGRTKLNTALWRRTDGQTERRLRLQLQTFFSLVVGGGEYRLHNPARGKFFFATCWMWGCVGPTTSPIHWLWWKEFYRERKPDCSVLQAIPFFPVLTETVAECLTLCAGHCVTGQSFVWALRFPLRSLCRLLSHIA